MSHAAEHPQIDDDDARLASLGYRPQLHRVLGLFSNFSVAFTYLSPMVGIYSLFVLGLGTGGPAYIWLNSSRSSGCSSSPSSSASWLATTRSPVLCTSTQVLCRSPIRLVRRLVLRVRPLDHGGRGRHRRRRLLRRADPQLVRMEPRLRRPLHDPVDHRAAPADPDDPQHHRRTGDGTGGAAWRVRRDPRHVRDRGHLGDPRLPPRRSATCSPRKACRTWRRTRSG